MPRRKQNPELQEKLAAVKRDQILDAARAVFAEKDYHRATIKDVAARAGVADGTVYNYFENKNALILGLMDRFTQGVQPPSKAQTATRKTAKLEQPAPLDLEGFVRSSTRERFAMLSDESISLFQAILPEIIANPDLRALYRERIIAPSQAGAEPIIEAISASSTIAPDRVRLALQLEAAMFIGLIVQRIIGDELLEQHWDDLPDAISDLMLRGFSATKPGAARKKPS